MSKNKPTTQAHPHMKEWQQELKGQNFLDYVYNFYRHTNKLKPNFELL